MNQAFSSLVDRPDRRANACTSSTPQHKRKFRNDFLNVFSICLGLGVIVAPTLSLAAIYDRNGNKLPDEEVNSPQVNWQRLKAENGKNYNGVGLLQVGYGSFCTAFFLNTKGNSNAPAYAATNGHCYQGATGFIGAKEIVVNRPSRMTLKLNYFFNNSSRVRSIPVRRVVYATMKNTDLAIIELNTTFKQLVKEGFIPLTIDTTPVKIGEPVKAVGIPLAGVNPSSSYIHKSVCQVGESVKVREDVYRWDESLRNRCSVVGGMSGSPMISLNTNRVVAILNTGVNDDALQQPACSLNRPCEVNLENKTVTFPHENYAQKVNKIPGCFNANGFFNLYRRSCQLEKI